MKGKTTFKGIIAGAVAGGIVSAMVTFGSSALPQKKAENIKGAFSQGMNVQTVADVTTDKKVMTVTEIAKHTGPSIVGISCTSKVQGYFGMQTSQSSGGSGIIIDSSGNIVTNYHVISGADTIKVKLNTGNEYDATLVGGDERTDIAVLKINSKEELHVASIGDSDSVEAGDLAVAIGNPLASELFGTVTAGVISGVNRTITVGQREMTLIQTDAAISPGNSGGALINCYGEVIGINSVKLVDDAAEGLGFAIPMNEAKPIIQDLLSYGYVKGRPSVGVSVREITKELAYYNNLLVDHGLYVMSVTDNGGAYKAGLVRGDIIVKFDSKDITTASELNNLRDKHKAGESVPVTIIRGGKEITVSLTLTEDISTKKN